MSKVRLGDIATVTMGQSPSSRFFNTQGEGSPFLQGSKTFGRMYPSIEIYTNHVTKTARKGDLLISVRAPVGEINIAPVDLCIGRGLCSVRANDPGNQTYLYYALLNAMDSLIGRQNGTVFGSVNRSDLENLMVCFLNKRDRKIVTDLLKALDSKINLNSKINDNLSF